MSSTARPIPDEIADVIYALLDDWRPTMPELPRPTRFVWGTADLSANARKLEIDEQDLQIDGHSPEHSFDDRVENVQRNQPISGELGNGWTFAGEFGGQMSKRYKFGTNESGSYFTIHSAYWHIVGPTRPRFWIGRVLGSYTNWTRGNLYARTAGGTWAEAGSLRLRGAYTYYIIQVKEDELFLIVQTENGEPPERVPLYRDFMTLQFVLGTTLKLDVLYAVIDQERSIGGLAGGMYGREHRKKARKQSPVPQRLGIHEAWSALFFERISATYRTREELRLHTPLVFYIESLTDYHVQEQYLKLQVGLEALAYWMNRTKPEPQSRIDKPKWKAWLKSQKEAIEGTAAPGYANWLYSTIAGVPKQRLSSRLVETMFETFRDDRKILLTEQMTEELDGRNSIAHTAEMFKEEELGKPVDPNKYRDKIALVRSLLVAMVALAVGYEGEICGWDPDPNKPAPAEWWPVTASAREEAMVRYEAIQKPAQ